MPYQNRFCSFSFLFSVTLPLFLPTRATKSKRLDWKFRKLITSDMYSLVICVSTFRRLGSNNIWEPEIKRISLKGPYEYLLKGFQRFLMSIIIDTSLQPFRPQNTARFLASKIIARHTIQYMTHRIIAETSQSDVEDHLGSESPSLDDSIVSDV